MKVIESKEYKNQLRKIAFNIRKDKSSVAIKFAKDLKKQIKNISNMPKKYRQSYYHNDENVRDMIYKGYTIIYKIYDKYIKIVEIFNQNLPEIERQ